MKRLIFVAAALFLAATAALGQEKTDFRTKIFEVHNRSPHDIYAAVRTLGSGSKGSDIDVNAGLRTITVRDFPENIAAIGEAIDRLDRPVLETGIDIKIAILIGSKVPMPGASVPDDLAPVVKQLQSTLRYSHFGLMADNVHRTTSGGGMEGSGIAEPTLLGITPEGKPIFYSYKLRNITVSTSGDRPTVSAETFAFSMRVPVTIGGGTQYQNVGFETPVTIRQNEKVVIGTTTLGEKALIVVVTANAETK